MECEYCGREQKIKRGVACWRCGAPLPVPVVEKSKTTEPFIRPQRLTVSSGAPGVYACSTDQTADFGVVWTSTGFFTGKDW